MIEIIQYCSNNKRKRIYIYSRNKINKLNSITGLISYNNFVFSVYGILTACIKNLKLLFALINDIESYTNKFYLYSGGIYYRMDENSFYLISNSYENINRFFTKEASDFFYFSRNYSAAITHGEILSFKIFILGGGGITNNFCKDSTLLHRDNFLRMLRNIK